MIYNNEGVWSITVGPVEPSMDNYYLLVDGVRTIDPGNPRARREGVNYASTLIVPGTGSALFEVNDLPHGSLSVENNYRVARNIANRAIACLSMSALQTQITNINNYEP